MVKAMDCGIVISELELQTHIYIDINYSIRNCKRIKDLEIIVIWAFTPSDNVPFVGNVFEADA